MAADLAPTVAGPVIDACAFHEWPSFAALESYVTPGWQQVINRKGDKVGTFPIASSWVYQNPLGRKAVEARPHDGPAGSDFVTFHEQVLSDERLKRVVIGVDDGQLSTAFPLPYAARQVIRAANEWTIEKWLEEDERLYGQMLIVSSLPDDSAEEIRRIGAHPKIVAVAMGSNGLGRPFGHPAYHPIFEAASELDLPLVIQFGSDAMADQPGASLSGGFASTFAEYDALAAVPMMAHAWSMIMGGVFDRFPNLRVLLVGGGAAWIPTALWRGDYQYKLMPSVEAPWMRGNPSNYFLKHFKVATWGLEAPANLAQLEAFLSVIPGIEDMLMYSSCYPNVDAETPEATAARLPAAWHHKVLYQNASDFYRWPDRAETKPEVSAMTLKELQEHTRY